MRRPRQQALLSSWLMVTEVQGKCVVVGSKLSEWLVPVYMARSRYVEHLEDEGVADEGK
jgi:hypothetical protein